jgi:DHA1 family bicyclomycin/chloramphenicol resistance-like MFS transporter
MSKKHTLTAKGPGPTEFVIMMAMLMSLMALSIDAVLPALSGMGRDLGAANDTDAQLIISVLFAGLGLGQLVWGPLSDSIGRKRAVYIGIGIFLLGSVISLFATDFTTMLIGRGLQGFGAAASRIVTVAIIRDSLSGRPMARVMSFIMAVFIFVPILAPMLGQAILYVGDWRLIFVAFIAMALGAVVWFGMRQKESLTPDRRKPLRLASVLSGMKAAAMHRTTFGYTIATGMMFAPFLAYLSTSQQIFQVLYQTGEAFVLYFAVGAATIGLSSILNGKIVMRYGMRRLMRLALVGQVTASVVMMVWMIGTGQEPSLTGLMIWFMVVFFGVGMLFGNMNTVAMEPQGDNAGAASAFIGFFSTIVGMPIGILAGQAVTDSVLALPLAFMGCGVAGLVVTLWADRGLPTRPVEK